MNLAVRLGAVLLTVACWLAGAQPAKAGKLLCSRDGIGAVALTADAPVFIVSATVEMLPEASERYCLVRVRVSGNVNIAVGLPMDGRWNGDLEAGGRGGYGGSTLPPVRQVVRGYVGVESDTGHPAAARDPEENPAADWRNETGAFAMLAPGVPNLQLQADFAHRSAHLMAVVGKQLAAAFYGRPVDRAYWNGCSTEGDRGLRVAQRHPEDYDGVLAGDPAIHFGQVMAYQIWPQLVMRERVGGPILGAKLDFASARAIAACDRLDGLADGLLADPRRCRYRATRDSGLVRASCTADDARCLSPVEARAVDEIWRGPLARDGKLLWRGIERGAPLGLLAGPRPFPYAIVQPRYWVYLDPAWDWRKLTIADYPAYFVKSVAAVNPIMGADDPDLAPFFARGGKIILYHGLDDAGILPQGSIDYYRAVARRMRLSPARLQSRFRLYLLPGVGHCGGGGAPQLAPDRLLASLVEWVEHGVPPRKLTAVQYRSHGERSRPVCAYPALARYRGSGDPDRAESFSC